MSESLGRAASGLTGAELARRVDMVYTAARRQVGDLGLAEEVTQGVFVLVVRKGIVEPSVGWLLKATYFGCREVLRRERRRRHHERKAGQMRATEQSGQAEAVEAEWDRIEPVLDGALLKMREGDREALVLRFLEDRSLKEVGEQLGISEEAARKRVERALERLREMLVGRGVSAGAGLGAALAGRCVERAPAGVHAAVASGSAGAGAVSLAAAIGRAILLGAMKVGVGIALVVIGAGVTSAVVASRAGKGPVKEVAVAPAATAGGMAGKAEYRGRLVDGAGKPVAGAAYQLVHYRWPVMVVDRRGTTTADGGFTSGLVAPIKMGEINDTFVFDAAGYGRAWSNVGTAWTVGPVEIRLEEARVIEGVVRNAEGAPVAGAVVEAQLQSERYGYLGLDQKDGLAVKTDEGGAFRFERVPADARAHVRVTPPAGSGYAIFDTSEIALRDIFPITAGTTDVEVELEKGTRVRLQVTHGGKALAKGGLHLVAIERTRTHRRIFAATDGMGRAEFAGMKPGTWDIGPVDGEATEEQQKILPAMGVTVAAGDAREVGMGYDEGILVAGRVRDEGTGAGVAEEVTIDLVKNRWMNLRALKTDEAGRFATHLDAGEYRVGYSTSPHGKSRWVFKTFRVGASGVEGGALELAVVAAPRVHGQVVDENGRGVAASVVLDDRPAATDTEGRFEMAAPDFFMPQVFGYAVDDSLTRGASFLLDQEGKWDLRLSLQPMATVVGKVADARPGGEAAGTELRLLVWAGGDGISQGLWKTELGEDGTFRIGPIPTGCSFDLLAEKDGLQAEKKIGELSPGEERNVGKLVLHPLGVSTRAAKRVAERLPAPVLRDATVSGRVLDEEGKPAAGVRIFSSAGDETTGSDLKGRFVLGGQPREGAVTLKVMDEDSSGVLETHGGAKDVEIRLKPIHAELIGKAPPALAVERWYGGGVKSWEELKGKVVLVEIGAWPRNFENELGEWEDLYERWHGSGLEMVTIFQRVDEGDVEQLVAEEKLPWVVGLDGPSGKLGNGAMYAEVDGSVTLVVDRSGKVRRCVGSDVEGWVERLMEEK